MNTVATPLKSAQAHWKSAQSRYEADKAKLYREDGSPLYAPAEHRERLAKLTDELRQRAEQARGNAQALQQAADATIAATQINPLLHITDAAARAEVSYKLPLVNDSVDRATMPQLAATLNAIAQHGSEVEKLLYLQAAERVITKYKAQALETGSGPNGGLDAYHAYGNLEKLVNGEAVARRTEAEKTKVEASRFVMRVNLDESALLGTEERPLVDAMRLF